MTSFAVGYRFARHFTAARNGHCSVLMLTLKLNLQVIIGLLVFIPFTLIFLNLYYNWSYIEKTVLVCVFTIIYAIPNLFLIHVATNLHGVCSLGDEILLVVTYITGTSI